VVTPKRIFCLLLLLLAPALLAAQTLLLKPSAEYLALLKVAHDHERRVWVGDPWIVNLYKKRLESFPVLPIDPYPYVLFGRLANPAGITDQEALLNSLRALFFRTAFKGGEGGLDPCARGEAIAPWFEEFLAARAADPGVRLRYLHLEDPLHSNSVSRFHFLIRQGPSVSAASAADPARAVWIQDLGSLNGTYVDGNRIEPNRWLPLPVGSRLRFGFQTRKARAYLKRIHAGALDFSGLAPLEAKDLHLEYELVRATEAELAAGWAWIEPPAAIQANAAEAGPPAGGLKKDPVEPVVKDGHAASASAPPAFLQGVMAIVECCVCHRMMYRAVALDCNHHFCEACIRTFFQLQGNPDCPLCRHPHHGAVRLSPLLNDIIALCATQLSADEQKDRREQVAAAEAALKALHGGQEPLRAAAVPDSVRYTVEPSMEPFSVCQAPACGGPIFMGQLKVRAEPRVPQPSPFPFAPPPALGPQYHPSCWVAMHGHELPRPVLHGRAALGPEQRRELDQIYPE
jgi:hypothetical protein